jgi:hypothetical protein
VNAANLAEDVSPNGTRGYGQSDTAIAASNNYVVEAWNDSTSFYSACGSPQNKEEETGFGFSADGGKTFTDMGGVPNTACTTAETFGDPSVAAWQAGGHSFFYISSLFIPLNAPQNKVAITTCSATGTNPSAKLACNQPIAAAQASDCNSSGQCGFLDKPFLAIDPVRGRLYLTYTELSATSPANGIIQLAVCDIGTPSGGVGPQGGTALKPICFNGSRPLKPVPAPYLTVAPADPACFQTGVYPAVDLATGDLYAAWEFNVTTESTHCHSAPANDIARVPFSCLTLPKASCTGPDEINRVNIVAMQTTNIPGYNGSLGNDPPNDFPRIAVSDQSDTVSIIWNDARSHLLGDIEMQTFTLGALSAIVGPVRLNSDVGGLHYLPAVSTDDSGMLNATWYQRNGPSTTLTNLKGVVGLSPLITSTPTTNITVTDVASDWNADTSDIVPNFGDYTDSHLIALNQPPYVGKQLFVAWSDGRLGEPQPFETSFNTHP